MEKKINIVEKGRAWKERNQDSKPDLLEIAHPVDHSLIRILEAAGINSLLNGAMEQLVSAYYGAQLASGIVLDEKSFPELYIHLKSCADRLGMQVPYTIITQEINGINACALGTDQKPFIMLSNYAPRLLDEQELKFIMGHECGHVRMEHMVYHTAGNIAAIAGGFLPVAGPALARIASFPLNYWNRCSEITADRLGLICCGDLKKSQFALLKIVGGFTDITRLDVDRYILQSKTQQDRQFLGKFSEYFRTHPMIYKRLQAMEYFASSRPYYQIMKREPEDGEAVLTKEELDQKVHSLMHVL